MNTDKTILLHQDLTECVIGAFYDTYNELGPGFLEGLYENALTVLLNEYGFKIERQVPIRVNFHGIAVGDYRIDLLVESKLIVEVKVAKSLSPMHEAQLINYLKVAGKPIGLLLNFGPRPQFKRLIFTSRSIRADPRKSAVQPHV